MKPGLALLAAALLSGCAAAQTVPSADLPPADPMVAVADILDAAEFHGEVLVSTDGNTVNRIAHDDFKGSTVWPWASVTKQVIAVAVLQQVERGNLSLDTPVANLLPDLKGSAATVGDLLQHRAGLANPDNAAREEGEFSAFYALSPAEGLRFCQSGFGPVQTEGYSYNNCDYIVLGRILESVSGETLGAVLRSEIGAPARWTDTALLTIEGDRGFTGATPLYRGVLPRYEGAGALAGPLEDMVRFDRALLDGKLLTPATRETLWRGDPALGYMALGQWSFTVPLAGCDAPVAIVERRGAIGKYQLRNIILPASGTIVVLATDRGEDVFDFGEIWSGSGVSHAVLSAVACS